MCVNFLRIRTLEQNERSLLRVIFTFCMILVWLPSSHANNIWPSTKSKKVVWWWPGRIFRCICELHVSLSTTIKVIIVEIFTQKRWKIRPSLLNTTCSLFTQTVSPIACEYYGRFTRFQMIIKISSFKMICSLKKTTLSDSFVDVIERLDSCWYSLITYLLSQILDYTFDLWHCGHILFHRWGRIPSPNWRQLHRCQKSSKIGSFFKCRSLNAVSESIVGFLRECNYCIFSNLPWSNSFIILPPLTDQNEVRVGDYFIFTPPPHSYPILSPLAVHCSPKICKSFELYFPKTSSHCSPTLTSFWAEKSSRAFGWNLCEEFGFKIYFWASLHVSDELPATLV